MDFLEAAAILIPALTGIEMTVYSGEPEILAEFERQYCFLPEVQEIYSLSGMKTFLERCSEGSIYDVSEPLGSRLTVFQAAGRWILLGPYVEEGWREPAARVLLTRLGASESALLPYQTYFCKLPVSGRDYVRKAARLILERTGSAAALENVKTVTMNGGRQASGIKFPDAHRDISLINKRYAMESRFITAISRGDTEAAREFLDRFREVRADLRFLSSDLSDQIAGAAIVRTLARMGARQGGLSAARIDSISQEYAQKMKHTVSAAELGYLQTRLVEHFCAEVRALRETQYPSCVRKAMDYIAVNLSQPLTVAEIAEAAGVERHLLTKAFAENVHMTVKQYLAKRRCEIAAELLRDSGTGVQEAAAFVGYTDRNYFSKVFKFHQGVTPQRYQRAYWPAGIDSSGSAKK